MQTHWIQETQQSADRSGEPFLADEISPDWLVWHMFELQILQESDRADDMLHLYNDMTFVWIRHWKRHWINTTGRLILFENYVEFYICPAFRWQCAPCVQCSMVYPSLPRKELNDGGVCPVCIGPQAATQLLSKVSGLQLLWQQINQHIQNCVLWNPFYKGGFFAPGNTPFLCKWQSESPRKNLCFAAKCWCLNCTSQELLTQRTAAELPWKGTDSWEEIADLSWTKLDEQEDPHSS